MEASGGVLSCGARGGGDDRTGNIKEKVIRSSLSCACRHCNRGSIGARRGFI